MNSSPFVAEEVRHQQVDVSDGLTIALSHRGGLDGVPIVFLHGLSQQRHFWGPVISRIGDRPWVSIDQRAHGESSKPQGGDYSIARAARDVSEALTALGIDRAVVVGHSWGAAVALQFAADFPGQCVAVSAIDGGIFSPKSLGDREEVRLRLTPPRVAIPESELFDVLSSGQLAPYWSDELAQALRSTFSPLRDGVLTTTIGFDRHMDVLDGLLDYDPAMTLPRVVGPAWIVLCDAKNTETDGGWSNARNRGVAAAEEVLADARLIRLVGAIHDVPLQWPDLIAGLVVQMHEDVRQNHR